MRVNIVGCCFIPSEGDRLNVLLSLVSCINGDSSEFIELDFVGSGKITLSSDLIFTSAV